MYQFVMEGIIKKRSDKRSQCVNSVHGVCGTETYLSPTRTKGQLQMTLFQTVSLFRTGTLFKTGAFSRTGKTGTLSRIGSLFKTETLFDKIQTFQVAVIK